MAAGGPYGEGAIPAEVVEAVAAERKRPEEIRLPPREWVKENLFSSWFNGGLTVVFGLFMLVAVRWLLGFIFDSERQWDSTATNLRNLMTRNYPVEQYVRVWVSVGIVLALAGLSGAAWQARSEVGVRKLGRNVLLVGIAVTGAGILAPTFSGSARFWYLLVGAILIVGGLALMRLVPKEAAVSTLLVFIGGTGLAVLSLWVIPYGHHALVEEGVIAESGTVARSTQVPWTVMWVLLIVSYFVGKALSLVLGERMRNILTVLWLLSPVVIVFLILRDPDFDYDHILSVEIPLFLAYAIGGGALLYLLTKPTLGEIGRIIGAIVLIVAVLTFPIPGLKFLPAMRQVIRICALLLAVFALAAPTFAGGRALRMRYVTAWVGLVGLTIFLVTTINTPSTVQVTGFFMGGLVLTLMVAVFTMILSFPIGVILALARTSKMPVFRVMATTYIEFVRGIPFITILIFFSIMLPLFLPENMEISEIAAVTIGFVLFSAAYLAENVRGGLQSVTRGQYEAADALGMTGAQRTVFIVLPQALRVSIPPLVGQAIATYKETSLLSIIGLFDLLLIARITIPNQTDFVGSGQENLLAASLIYWVGAYSMSRASRKLEQQVGLGER